MVGTHVLYPSLTRMRSAVGRAARRLLAVALAGALTVTQIHAAQAIGLIRDAEIEQLLSDYATPIFRAANLSSQNINIHIVSEKSFNAFVIDGQNMFIHIGAITKSDTPNQLIGVIAHEAGHIAGGHLARLRVQISRMESAALIMNLIGIGAMVGGAVAGGGNDVGEAGAAVLYGGTSIIQRSLLSYQRAEESAADQAAVNYLNKTKQSGRGMIETFRHFADQSLGSVSFIDPYLQSHPMPQSRIAQLRDLTERSQFFNDKDSPQLQFRHDMVRAKLEAFTSRNNAAYVMRKYPESDRTLPARYARAITKYFTSGMRGAAADIDALIADQPNNPYFHEIKGQFLLESGKAREALPSLRKAVSLAPQSGLIRVMLSHAMIEANDPSLVNEAVGHLQKALVREKQSVIGYRQLAIAYDRLNRAPEARLASAQAAFFEGNAEHAKLHAEMAMRGFPEGSPNWVKANDILRDVETYKKMARR
jgi:predicted Zn-dependent protease